MLTLTSILAGLTWLASNLWILFIALVPSVLQVISPILSAIVDGLRQLVSTIWEGIRTANFNTWVLTAALSAIAFGVGYHYGWNACLDWAHAHFKWISKLPVSSWWKFW